MDSFLKLCNSVRTRYLRSVKIYDDAEVNRIFWYSSMLGGIITTKKINSTVRMIWLVANISLILTMVIMNLIYYHLLAEKNFTTLLKLSQPFVAMTLAYSTWITFAVYQKNAEAFTEDMDMYIKNTIFDEDISDIRAKVTLNEIILGTMPTSLFIIGLLVKFFLPDLVFLGEIASFTYPFADKFQTDSATKLTAILFVQFLTTLPVSLNIFCALHLIQMYITLFDRIFELSRKHIRKISSSTLQKLETNHNEELLIEMDDLGERNYLARTFIAQRDRISDDFEKELRYWMKTWYQLQKVRPNLHPLFEFASSWFVAILHIVQIPLGEQIISVMYDPSRLSATTFYACCFFFLNTYLLYQICYIGERITKSQEEFLMEVYSTPWYMLSKKHRQNVHTFLTMASCYPTARVFQTKLIGMPLLYEILDSWYSNISVLRELLKKEK